MNATPTVSRVLLVEDNRGDVDLVREALEGDSGHWQVDCVSRLADALAALDGGTADVTLLDLSLPDASGLDAVTGLLRARPDVPVVVLTGLGDPEAGRLAVQQGAQEFLLKNELDRRILGRVLRYSIERHAASERARGLAREQAAREAAENSRRRVQLLADASIAVSSTLDEEQALARVSDVLVPRLAAYCAIERLDVNDHVRCLVAFEDPTGSRRRIACDAADSQVHEALRASWARGARIEDSAVHPACCGPAVNDDLQRLAVNASIIVPLRLRDQMLGTLVLGTAERYGLEDLGLAEEIARRVVAAVEMSRLHAQALDAIQVRDNFLSIAGHELRNPLGQIVSDVWLIGQRKEPYSDPLRRSLERIGRSAERLRSLIDELLDVSRIRAGRFVLDLTDTDLGATVRAVVERVAGAFANAAADLHVHADASVYGRWDPSRIEQVVANLLQNAVRYAPGHPVDVTVAASGDTARLSVRDHGPGIDPADRERIFEQFSRVSTARGAQGLGLGLWISRGIVEAHGGRIWVESPPGDGADFRVELPCAGPRRGALVE